MKTISTLIQMRPLCPITTCYFLTVCIMLIIGIPTIIQGCSEVLCPLYRKQVAKSVLNVFFKKRCTRCLLRNEDGHCVKRQEYDCSNWGSLFDLGNGVMCSSNRVYTPGRNYTIFFNKRDGDGSCDPNEKLSYVGIVFISLACLTCLSLPCCLFVSRVRKHIQKRHRRLNNNVFVDCV